MLAAPRTTLAMSGRQEGLGAEVMRLSRVFVAREEPAWMSSQQSSVCAYPVVLPRASSRSRLLVELSRRREDLADCLLEASLVKA